MNQNQFNAAGVLGVDDPPAPDPVPSMGPSDWRWVRCMIGSLKDRLIFGKAFMIFFAFGAGTSGNDAVGVSSKTVTNGLSGIWYQWLWRSSTAERSSGIGRHAQNAAAEAGFTVNTPLTTVLGFSLTGSKIPIGENNL
ncbi:MAG TPA: hypothetical protein EYQ00_04245, partial [Dehalococcoidia bacterium]|nr:hypothetical protein [Dehalococcoidia bacterium]